MIKAIKLTLILITAVVSSFAQQKFTISGTVRSQRTGETLIGATIRAGAAGTSSNDYGFFSLTLEKGKYNIEATAVGMQTKSIPVTLDKDITLNLALEDEQKTLENITIIASSKSRSLSSPQMGIERLTSKEIKNIPAVARCIGRPPISSSTPTRHTPARRPNASGMC